MADPNWKDIGRDVLQKYLNAEKGGSGGDAGQFGIDIFNNGFEDEFPGDNDDPVAGTYQSYSLEANRASENRPWGGKFGDRPKIHELNQPEAAQVLGWRVIDFYPNRDFKSEFYRLAGTPAELRQMMQIVQAVRFVTGARVNFEAWFEEWEKGFPNFKDERNGNFLLTGDKQWERIKKPETRPRFREWTNSQQRADYGFRVIEYWRDRSVESDSILLSGTDLQLIQHIIQIEYEGGGQAANKDSAGAWPSLKGQPLITLYFRGENDAHAKISLRITNKSDDPKSTLPKIDKGDLLRYANRIKKELATPSLFVWRKGREVISYKNRQQGFDGNWYLCRNKASGMALLQKLLAILELPLDPASVRMSLAVNEELAFPRNPPEIVVLGESVQQEKERPLVDVVFRRAEIKLSKLRSPIALVSLGAIVYKS